MGRKDRIFGREQFHLNIIYLIIKPMKDYKVVNGTSYHIETPDKLIEILETIRENQTRVIFDFGDVKTKTSWGEVYDISGRIGRSTGTVKIPLLIHNRRSMGGGALLDHCILSIKTSIGKVVLYQL